MKNEQKNFVLFAVLAAIILFGWPMVMGQFFPTATAPATKIEAGREVALPQPEADPAANTPTAVRDRAIVLAESPRIRIDTPAVSGSINLRGARIDDLILKRHDQTIAENSAPIRLLSPAGTDSAYYAGFGWRMGGAQAPGADTMWRASGQLLAPGTPVTLEADNGSGQRFRIELAIDDNYMFTVRQTVANAGGQPITATPYGYLSRRGRSTDPDQWIAHVGPMAVRDGSAAYVGYDDLAEAPTRYATTGGWAGFTDHYWLTAIIPDQGVPAELQLRQGAGELYQADFVLRDAASIASQASVTHQSRLFAGAKEVRLIDRYEDELGIVQFDQAIDWGWFRIIEKPIFYYLDWLFRLVGNFGVAIILLTITIRLILFPIAQKQFASMASMRAIQPKLKALQARHKDDKPRLQQEMMALYKTEKVNPLAGCLPMFLQIPIMFALYKVLILTIEMRHQPFALWIRDLSAPDPLTPINLFGLLPFTPPSFIAIGVFPILLGISMWAQFKLNPAPMDEMQKQVFAIMPWMLMFLMAPFAAGLQLYWITSNVLTMAQQWWLYRSHPALKTAAAK